MSMVNRALKLVGVLGSLAVLPLAATETDCLEMLAGVSQINAGGLPGPVTAFGPEAFAVAVGEIGSARLPLVAATRFGKGRAIAFGKGEFFVPGALADADNATFVTNCLVWASAKAKPRIGVVDCAGFAEALRAKGLDAVDIALADLATVDVIVTKTTRLTPPEEPRLQHLAASFAKFAALAQPPL